MKTKLIVNPVSGTNAAPDHLASINERLRQHGDALDIGMTVAEGDASRMAADAVRDGYDRLIVAGGDGTLNDVLNGVGLVQDGFERVTFGVIPLGTGNDFATALGIPEDIDAAVEALLQADPASIDVGRINDRYFINVSGGGFIAEVSDAVNPQLKTIAGKLAYLVGGAQVLLNHEPVGARVTVSNPGEAERARDFSLHAFAVCNSRLIGGGRLIAPDAVIDDGELDVCLIEAMPTMEFVSLLRRVSTGEHVHDDRVSYFRASRVAFRFDRVVKVNTDGQVVETDSPSYEVLPRAARFLLPRAG
jgi:diacylglycerol kinase (ATP)